MKYYMRAKQLQKMYSIEIGHSWGTASCKIKGEIEFILAALAYEISVE